MSETLALETQLLLQEVTQATQYDAVVAADAVDGADGAAPAAPVSALEAAKQALVDKLRKKKEQSRERQQQLFAKRYGFVAPTPKTTASEEKQDTPAAKALATLAPARLTPSKAKRMVRLPVTAASAAGPRQKKELLSQLRTQAIKQGGHEIAKLFGYKSYEEQIKKLNKDEKKIILESTLAEMGAVTQKESADKDGKDEDSSSDFVADAEDAEENEEEEDEDEDVDNGVDAGGGDEDVVMVDSPPEVAAPSATQEPVVSRYEHDETQDVEALEAASRQSAAPIVNTIEPVFHDEEMAKTPSATRRRRNHITLDEDDGNEADSEDGGKDQEEDEEEAEEVPQDKTPRDKAAAFRQLLQAEAKQERKRKRLRNGDNFVESEADEDEEEDVLKIGGLGDFGFGVPQATSKEAKDAEEERNALKMREDDLEGIVDDLSDEERDQAQDLDEIYRRELEEQDRQQVKEVMRNVKEGFGRNRRAFSGLDGGIGARGRFNLNQLVAADGDKFEAARLGLLESDEDMSEKEEGEDADESKKAEGEEEDEDEEAEMERMLRERYTNQPKIYITSSESENEDENEPENEGDEAVKEEIESDEERERQQMKLFSERARINRRMQRMKDMQRQIAEEVEEEGVPKAPMPNLLLEEDEDSHSLLKVLTRTDVTQKFTNTPATADKSAAKPTARAKTAIGAARPKVGRFTSFGMGSTIRSTSSFSRVADNCKLFSTGSGTNSTTKGFVFTSFSSDKGDENAAPSTEDSDMPPASTGLSKSKSWGGTTSSRSSTKRPFAASNGASSTTNAGKNKKSKSDFFSVLASYQCVSQSHQ